MLTSNNHGVLLALLADLREKEVAKEVDSLLRNGFSPNEILKTCQQGMNLVGQLYSNGEYFISGLIMAGEIMRQVALLLTPAFQKENEVDSEKLGVVLLGTVKGDIHDIGKNLFKNLLQCQGFLVEDLGIDVQPKDFLDAVQRVKPDIIGISSLLTSSYESLCETITLINETMEQQQLKVPVMIGGGMINAKVCKIVGANCWAPDAVSGSQMCKDMVASARGLGRIMGMK